SPTLGRPRALVTGTCSARRRPLRRSTSPCPRSSPTRPPATSSPQVWPPARRTTSTPHEQERGRHGHVEQARSLVTLLENELLARASEADRMIGHYRGEQPLKFASAEFREY